MQENDSVSQVPQNGSDSADHEPALIVAVGRTRRRMRSLSQATTILGRARGCDIALNAMEVSYVHCHITRTPQGLVLRDCASRTGTLVNGQPIQEAALSDGDTIQVGPFLFRVQVPAAWNPADEFKARQNQIAELRREVDRLGRKRRRLAESTLRQRRRFRSLRQDLAEARRLLAQMENENASMVATPVDNAPIEPVPQEIANLQQENDSLRQMLVRSALECDQLRKKAEGADEATVNASALEQEMISLRDELARLQANSQQLQSELVTTQSAAAQVGELRQRLDSAGEINNQLKQKVGVYEQKMQRAREVVAENERLKQQLAEARQQLEATSLPAGVVEVQPPSSAEADAASEEFNARLENERRAHEERLTGLRGELEKERTRFKELIKQTAAQHGAVQHELTELRAKLEERDLALSTLVSSDEFNAVREKLTLAEEVIERLRQQLQERPPAPEIPPELSQYEASLNEFRDQLATAQEQIKVHEDELDAKMKAAELTLSKERAELARQRALVERTRRDFLMELEHAEREAQQRERMAPVQRLKDELKGRAEEAEPDAESLTGKIRRFLKRIQE